MGNVAFIDRGELPYSAVAAKTLLAKVYSEAYGDKEQSIANANLIAAAPALVEALEDLLERFESEIHNEYDGTSMLEERLKEADKAREALALAYGETQ